MDVLCSNTQFPRFDAGSHEGDDAGQPEDGPKHQAHHRAEETLVKTTVHRRLRNLGRNRRALPQLSVDYVFHGPLMTLAWHAEKSQFRYFSWSSLMRAWDFNLSLEPSMEMPMFLRIARGISNEVRRSRLRPGDPLPGSRTLAKALQVHRNTIVAAYVELLREGWIETRPAGGTFISRTLPDVRPRGFKGMTTPRVSVPAKPGFDLPPNVENLLRGTLCEEPFDYPRGTFNLSSGAPDSRLVPVDALARAYRRALRARGSFVLNYGDPRGHAR